MIVNLHGPSAELDVREFYNLKRPQVFPNRFFCSRASSRLFNKKAGKYATSRHSAESNINNLDSLNIVGKFILLVTLLDR
jgi:hypothetical protein